MSDNSLAKKGASITWMPGKSGAGSTASRLLLGRELRRLREQKGMRTEDAAAEVGVARATLWRMEKGGSRCRYRPGDVETLGRLYGANRDTIHGLIGLVKTTRTRSWTVAYRDVLPDTVATYIDLESYACRIRCYVTGVVPILLQDEGYASALSRASRRMANIRRHTQVRMHRQAILTRQPVTTTFEFVLDEAVLHRAVGESSTMTEQLNRLGELADLPNATIRVVPYLAGMYPGLEANSFEIMDFPNDSQFGGLPTTVYIGQLNEHILLDNAREVAPYAERWNDVCARALDQTASKVLVGDLRRHLAHR